jgi:NAD-dependent SIR2 family protein deacetylase
MPCGGIYPISKESDFGKMHGSSDHDECFHCGKAIQTEDLMFCDEWDCYLHRDCVIEFLKGEEGKIVLAHGHSVVLYWEKEADGSQSK